MRTEERKAFNLDEQRAKDFLAAIKVVTPVIALIREWGEQEKEYNEAMEKEETLSKEIESIKYVLRLVYTDGELKDSLSTILEKKETSYKEVLEQTKQLKAICDSYEKEVINYQKYVQLFIDVDEEIMLDVLQLKLLKTKDEVLAIIFFMVNNNTFDIESLKEMKPCFFKGFDGLLSNLNWNKMLRQLKAGVI